MKLCEFIRPEKLSDARNALRKLGPKGMPLAGGTALHFMNTKTPGTAVDITRLGLSYIRQEAGAFVIGAATPLSDIQRYRSPRWSMHEICRRISTHQIRNVSTIGGNICRVFPWADLPVVLLAMNARMMIYTGKKKEDEVGADDFFASQPARRFAGGDLLTAVKIPFLKANHGFGSVKAARNAAAFSLVTVAALLELKDGRIQAARVAAGSAIPFPKRLRSVEAALIGNEAIPEVFRAAAAKATEDAKWCKQEGMSAEYIKDLAEVSLVDALERAAEFARGRTK
ncbi:MAG TPA: FAD binding domain-containing protein [Elusimicrobiales bacterium]|nr:FAD binding domain-containing protein [Elusimicrobiales bacterium]